MDIQPGHVSPEPRDPVSLVIAKSATDLALERKVRTSAHMLLAERAWLRLWWVFAVAGAFLAVSLAGVWPLLPFPVHVAMLCAFGLALTGALTYVARVPVPGREEALRRLERTSGQPHRPASSYEDTLSAEAQDPATRALWQAHRARLAALLSKLRPGADRKSVV